MSDCISERVNGVSEMVRERGSRFLGCWVFRCVLIAVTAADGGGEAVQEGLP